MRTAAAPPSVRPGKARAHCSPGFPHGKETPVAYTGQSLKRLEDPRLLTGQGAFLDDLVVSLQRAGKYRRLGLSTVIGTKRCGPEGSSVIAAAPLAVVTPSKPTVRIHAPASAHGNPSL